MRLNAALKIVALSLFDHEKNPGVQIGERINLGCGLGSTLGDRRGQPPAYKPLLVTVAVWTLYISLGMFCISKPTPPSR
jgi:hypothetical protein